MDSLSGLYRDSGEENGKCHIIYWAHYETLGVDIGHCPKMVRVVEFRAQSRTYSRTYEEAASVCAANMGQRPHCSKMRRCPDRNVARVQPEKRTAVAWILNFKEGQ